MSIRMGYNSVIFEGNAAQAIFDWVKVRCQVKFSCSPTIMWLICWHSFVRMGRELNLINSSLPYDLLSINELYRLGK